MMLGSVSGMDLRNLEKIAGQYDEKIVFKMLPIQCGRLRARWQQ
jgi:hypothetical protein